MTLTEIKAAIQAGKKVFWKNEGYIAQKDLNGNFHIICLSNNNSIALTWDDGITLNGNEEDFVLDSNPNYVFDDMEATFTKVANTFKITSLGFTVHVKGFMPNKINVLNGIIDDNGYMTDLKVNLTGSDNGVSTPMLEVQELNQILLDSINATFSLVDKINKNKMQLTPESLKHLGDFDITIFEK